MASDDRVVKLPNQHRGDIGEGLLKKLLEEAGITVDEWLGIKPASTDSETNDQGGGGPGRDG